MVRKKENFIILNEWMATIANKIYMQNKGRVFKSNSSTANAMQLKDHSRYDVLDIHWFVPIYK